MISSGIGDGHTVGVDEIADQLLHTLLGGFGEVPPYVIFQDPSLEAMATIYPVTLDELQNIPGVGAGKAKRYGEEFCKLIKRHCEENEIERPEDLRVRTVANKSKMKVAIIQAIDPLINASIKPIIHVIALPFSIVSFGLPPCPRASSCAPWARGAASNRCVPSDTWFPRRYRHTPCITIRCRASVRRQCFVQRFS